LNVFILISSGQNIANLLPVLERHAPGDQVIWLESSLARRTQWSSGAIEVLHRHGVPAEAIQKISFEEHPDALIQAIEPALKALDPSLHLCWVGNGGTKPQSLALAQALDRHGGYAYLYNLHQPAGYEYFPNGLGGQRYFCPYRKFSLELEDLLRVSVHEFFGGRLPEQLWPSDSPPEVSDPWYGTNANKTLDDCVRQHRRARNLRTLERPKHLLPQLRAPELGKRYPELQARWDSAAQEWTRHRHCHDTAARSGSLPSPSSETVQKLLQASHEFARAADRQAAAAVPPPDENTVQRWLDNYSQAILKSAASQPASDPAWGSLFNFTMKILGDKALTDLRTPVVLQTHPQAFARWKESAADLLQSTKPSHRVPQDEQALFNLALTLAEEGYHRLKKAMEPKALQVAPGSGGNRLEQAAAVRLWHWLQDEEQAEIKNILAGAWSNVRIARRDQPQINVQELDIALLLRNGILLNLECKAGQFDTKDLNSRIFVMWESTSLQARMAVVVPMFTACPDAEARAAQRARWNRLQNLKGMTQIPFTLPGQPSHWPEADQCPDPVPSFEQSLRKLLQGYCNA